MKCWGLVGVEERGTDLALGPGHLVVDFLTYVFIPAYAVVASGLLPLWLAVACAIAIVLSGALYFADRQMKTSDYYFRGFPAVWNVPLFYLFLLRPPAWVTAVAIFVLAICTFLPIPFVHPLRVRRGRVITIALLAQTLLPSADVLIVPVIV